MRLCLLLCILGLAFGESWPVETLAECQTDRSRLEARIKELETIAYSSYPIKGTESPSDSDDDDDDKVPFGTAAFYQILLMVVFVILTQSLANGLTMGLVSLDPLDLEVIVKKSDEDMYDPKEAKQLRDDQVAARRVLPLIHDHHLLMVTVLLVNCICGEVLPLFLDRLVPSWLSLILSVTLVLMFSEVIPSAIFTGSRQLSLAAQFSPLVRLWRCMFFPIALPIARLLDVLLGVEHKGRYNFAELRAIVRMHAGQQIGGGQEAVFKCHDDQFMGVITTEKPHNFTSETAVVFTSNGDVPAKSTKLEENTAYYVKKCKPLIGRNMDCTFQLFTTSARTELIKFEPGELTSGVFQVEERDEIKIAQGAMLLSHASAAEHMQREEAITLDKAFMLEVNELLSCDLLDVIDKKGYSRVPVYENNKHNVRGFILTKKLTKIFARQDKDKDFQLEKMTIGASMEIMPMIVADPNVKMLDLLNNFQEERVHFALVSNQPALVQKAWHDKEPIPPHVHLWGIITLEDVIERLLQEKIDDEFDSNKDSTFNTSMIRDTRRMSSRQTTPPVARPSRARSWHESSRLIDPLLGEENA